MRISRAVCAILLSVSICGCASCSSRKSVSPDHELNNRESVLPDPENARRFKAESGLSVSLVTDARTGVQYVYVNEAHGGGLAVLVDADGRPILADGKETE